MYSTYIYIYAYIITIQTWLQCYIYIYIYSIYKLLDIYVFALWTWVNKNLNKKTQHSLRKESNVFDPILKHVLTIYQVYHVVLLKTKEYAASHL